MTVQELSQDKVADFGDRMISVLNNAATALMTSIGHQTGLFDTISRLSTATSRQISVEAQLNERYVREWLAAMVTMQIIQYDPLGNRYSLPPEHAAWLTRSAGADNIARDTQFVAMLGEVEQGLVDCFKNGGGVPYDSYSRFQNLMAENSRSNTHNTLLDITPPLIPGMIQQLTCGISVADIGCGQGFAIHLLEVAFPNSRFTGFDFSDEAIAFGRANAQRSRLSNAQFEAKDVSKLNLSGQFDLIMAFDAIYDQAKPAEVLKGIAAALKPGGVFLMVEPAASSNLEENLEHTLGSWLYTISCMHCMTVSLALDGEGLGTMRGEQKARQMLKDAGFQDIRIEHNEADSFNNYFVAYQSML